jgi:twitching motility protein PilT
LPKASGQGRCLAMEIMVPNAAIRNLIREDKVHQIYSAMQVGQDKHGMQTLNQCLYSLFTRRQITLEEAMTRSGEPDELRMLIEKGAQARLSGGRPS